MNLKSIHHIEVLKRSNTQETIMDISRKPISNAFRTLDHYMNETSLPAVLARMTACDGLSFNIFTTFEVLVLFVPTFSSLLTPSVVMAITSFSKFITNSCSLCCIRFKHVPEENLPFIRISPRFRKAPPLP